MQPLRFSEPVQTASEATSESLSFCSYMTCSFVHILYYRMLPATSSVVDLERDISMAAVKVAFILHRVNTLSA